MTASPAQLRYLADAVSTASPARRTVMLYDRLSLDVRRGIAAQEAGDPVAVREQLNHANLILGELVGSLNVSAWDGGPNLASLYLYLINEFIAAGTVTKPGQLAAAAEIIAGLRSSWKQAEIALQAPASSTGSVEARSAAWVA